MASPLDGALDNVQTGEAAPGELSILELQTRGDDELRDLAAASHLAGAHRSDTELLGTVSLYRGHFKRLNNDDKAYKMVAVINAANAALVYRQRQARGSVWRQHSVSRSFFCWFCLFARRQAAKVGGQQQWDPPSPPPPGYRCCCPS